MYDLYNSKWSNSAKLNAKDSFTGDRFGTSIALHNNKIVSGSYTDDDDGFSSGSAYIFKRPSSASAHWTQLTKLVASNAGGGQFFGRSVAISAFNNAEYVLVGCYGDDDIHIDHDSGSVFVFQPNAADKWSQQMRLKPSDGKRGDYFGYSVAMYKDKFAVGAYGYDYDANILSSGVLDTYTGNYLTYF